VVNTEKSRERIWHGLGLLCLVFTFGVQAQTVREEAILLDKPEGKPGAVKLSAGSAVKALRRQGFWVEVDAAGKVGWLKVSQINFAGATGGATAIDTGRLGTGNIVATSAARGLSAKDLVSGQPNFNEAGKLDSLTTDAPTVQSFLVAGAVVASTEIFQLSAPRPNAAPATAPAPAASGGQATGAPSTGKKKGDDDW
jgi:hypothetical protein